MLTSAADDGLDANDYGAEHLRKAIDSAASGPPLPDQRIVQIDLALTSAMVRYLADVHGGRVDPQRLAENYAPTSSPGFDPEALLLIAIASDRLAEAARRAAFAERYSFRDGFGRSGRAAWPGVSGTRRHLHV